MKIETARLLGEVLEAPPPIGRPDERPLVAKAHARQILAGLDAHLRSAEDGPLLHPTVLALEAVELPHRQERTQREHDGRRAAPSIAKDGGVLPAHQGERHLELAAGHGVRPARERILIEAREVERRCLGVCPGELVLGELEEGARLSSGARHAHRGVDVREDDVARSRWIERRDEEPVVAPRVHPGDRRAGVSSRAVGVQPLFASAREIAADHDLRPNRGVVLRREE